MGIVAVAAARAEATNLAFPRGQCETPNSALVWMHGLGDTEKGWTQVFREQVLPVLAALSGYCLLVAPVAPKKHVTCNGGRIMTSWFDMAKLPVNAGDAPRFGCSLLDARVSAQRIDRIVSRLRSRGIPADRIVVGGFSQGGAMAMLCAMGYPFRLAGCISFSGLLLGSDQLGSLVHPVNQNLDVLWCHGVRDDVLWPTVQQMGCTALEKVGARVQRRRYDVGHQVHPDAIDDATVFLARCFTGDQHNEARTRALIAACKQGGVHSIAGHIQDVTWDDLMWEGRIEEPLPTHNIEPMLMGAHEEYDTRIVARLDSARAPRLDADVAPCLRLPACLGAMPHCDIKDLHDAWMGTAWAGAQAHSVVIRI